MESNMSMSDDLYEGNNKTKKIRLSSPDDLINRIKKMPLRERLELLSLINLSIEEDKKNLQDQLSLISGNGTKYKKGT